ncbi:MAG: nuclear transport factor 2 family protein [bacterium]|nr:nuclear transport factor 2 family protein [bacterium]
MKKIAIVILFTSLVLLSNSQDLLPEKTIVAAFDAIARLDIDRLKSYCTDDIIIIENGPIWNMDSLIQRLLPRRSDTSFKRINKIDFLQTEVEGNTAWTYYINQASGISNNKLFKVKWIESAVLISQNGNWKIKLLHSTVLERK